MKADKIAYWVAFLAFVVVFGLLHPIGEQISGRWSYSVTTVLTLPVAAVVYVVVRHVARRSP